MDIADYFKMKNFKPVFPKPTIPKVLTYKIVAGNVLAHAKNSQRRGCTLNAMNMAVPPDIELEHGLLPDMIVMGVRVKLVRITLEEAQVQGFTL